MYGGPVLNGHVYHGLEGVCVIRELSGKQKVNWENSWNTVVIIELYIRSLWRVIL